MLTPAPEELLEQVIHGLEEVMAEGGLDEHVASRLRTATQLLRSVRVGLELEPAALEEDNADLAALLGTPVPAGQPRAAAAALRAALITRLEQDPELAVPAGAWSRRSSERQRPWMVDAFTGPRR
ncbi:MAG: hypothetical protein ABR549_17585 [Mycobacteriales bacterium]